MAEAESDVKSCDTSKSLEESIGDEMADGKIKETISNSSTFDFAERSWKTDLTLIVEGTKFYVAKVILAVASPVFERMFQSDFKESATDELELPGKKADDVNEFLLAIYPNSASVMSEENALKVLPLADEYQVLNLKRRCEKALLGSIDTLTTIEELYQLIKEAHLYCLKELLKTCISFVCDKSVEQIQRANREIVLPGEPLIDILQKLNDRLVLRVKELELSRSHQAEQLETYKAWKNYFSKKSKKSELLQLDEDLTWLGKTLTFKLDLKKRNSVAKNVSFWNTKLVLQFDFQSVNYILHVHANLKISDKNKVRCKFKIQFVVVNKMPSEEHLFISHSSTFDSFSQSTGWNVASLSAIEDPKKGFVYEGKVQLEVNVFMSEPANL